MSQTATSPPETGPDSAASKADELANIGPQDELSTIGRIIASLLAMKRWIHVWMAIMMSAMTVQLAWLPSMPSVATTALMVGVGSVNVPLLFYNGGFFRLHAASHLPFLVAYEVVMWLWIAGGTGPIPDFSDEKLAVQILGIVCLTIFTVCFLFDIYDAYMYFGCGHTYTMGSARAFQAGASLRSVALERADLWEELKTQVD